MQILQTITLRFKSYTLSESTYCKFNFYPNVRISMISTITGKIEVITPNKLKSIINKAN